MAINEMYLALITSFAFSLAGGICIAVAINTDAKANNLKNRHSWVTFGFFFGFIALLIYFICRGKSIKKSPDYCKYCDTKIPEGTYACPQCNQTELVKHTNKSKKSTAITIICIALAVALVYGGRFDSKHFSEFYHNNIKSVFTDLDNSFSHIAYSPDNAPGIEYFYDRNKKAYIDTYEVLYYSQDGEEFIFELRDKQLGLTSLRTDDFYKSEVCFVDTDGYLVIDDTLYESIDYFDYSAEKDGKRYYLAAYVSWDNHGNLVDRNGIIADF